MNKLFFNFLWNNKPDKIKRSIAKQKLLKGGLGMVDVKNFEESLKLTWIKKFFESSAAWKFQVERAYPIFKKILPNLVTNTVRMFEMT